GAASCTSTAAPTSPVSGSTYAISCALGTLAAGNYGFHFNGGQLTVNKATLEVTANDKSRIYGDVNPGFDATISAFKNGETLATSGVTGAASCSSAAAPTSPVSGSPYAISCALGTLAAANYDFTYVTGHLTVTVAHLTVTAQNKSREYGDANPAFTHLTTGFKNSETESVLTTAVACGSAATATSSVAGSAYDITCSDGVAANYDFTYVTGHLTVTVAHLTVTAQNKSREYGDANPAFTHLTT